MFRPLISLPSLPHSASLHAMTFVANADETLRHRCYLAATLVKQTLRLGAESVWRATSGRYPEWPATRNTRPVNLTKRIINRSTKMILLLHGRARADRQPPLALSNQSNVHFVTE